MVLIRFLFYAIACSILFAGMLIALAGEVWLLRIVVIWLFDKDLVKEIEKWVRNTSTK